MDRRVPAPCCPDPPPAPNGVLCTDPGLEGYPCPLSASHPLHYLACWPHHWSHSSSLSGVVTHLTAFPRRPLCRSSSGCSSEWSRVQSVQLGCCASCSSHHEGEMCCLVSRMRNLKGCATQTMYVFQGQIHVWWKPKGLYRKDRSILSTYFLDIYLLLTEDGCQWENILIIWAFWLSTFEITWCFLYF